MNHAERAEAYFEEYAARTERERDQSSSRAEEVIAAFFDAPAMTKVDFISPLGLVRVRSGVYDWFASRNYLVEGLLSETDVDDWRW